MSKDFKKFLYVLSAFLLLLIIGFFILGVYASGQHFQEICWQCSPNEIRQQGDIGSIGAFRPDWPDDWPEDYTIEELNNEYIAFHKEYNIAHGAQIIPDYYVKCLNCGSRELVSGSITVPENYVPREHEEIIYNMFLQSKGMQY